MAEILVYLNKVYAYFSLQVAVEATVEHPFYAIGHGWSSSSPNRSLAKFQLPCHQLKVGDICISLSQCNNNNNNGYVSEHSLIF